MSAALTVPVDEMHYFMAHYHIAKCWGGARPESLRWFAETLASGRGDELPRLIGTPIATPREAAQPRMGVFGKRACDCCRSALATGEWECEFTTKTKHLELCFGCAGDRAYTKWSGHFSAKLLRVRLLRTYDRESPQFEVKHVFLPQAQYLLALEALSNLEVRAKLEGRA
jgi:hypothetical protein